MSETKHDDGEFIAEGALDVHMGEEPEDSVWEFTFLSPDGIGFITSVDKENDDPLHLKPVTHEGALFGGEHTEWMLNCITEEIEEKHKVPKIGLVGKGMVIIRDKDTKEPKAYFYLHPAKTEGGEPFWVHILPTVEDKNIETPEEETSTGVKEECQKPNVFETPLEH